MVDEVPTDERTADVQERQVHIRAPLVADTQTAIAVEPRQSAFHNPPMPTESLARLNAAPRDTSRDRPLAQLVAQGLRVIRFVGVQLRVTLTRPAAPPLDGFDGVHRCKHHPRVMHVGRAHRDGERDALPVNDHMAFRARFAAIRWIRPGFTAPFSAGTAEESRAARDQSNRPEFFSYQLLRHEARFTWQT